MTKGRARRAPGPKGRAPRGLRSIADHGYGYPHGEVAGRSPPTVNTQSAPAQLQPAHRACPPRRRTRSRMAPQSVVGQPRILSSQGRVVHEPNEHGQRSRDELRQRPLIRVPLGGDLGLDVLDLAPGHEERERKVHRHRLRILRHDPAHRLALVGGIPGIDFADAGDTAMTATTAATSTATSRARLARLISTCRLPAGLTRPIWIVRQARAPSSEAPIGPFVLSSTEKSASRSLVRAEPRHSRAWPRGSRPLIVCRPTPLRRRCARWSNLPSSRGGRSPSPSPHARLGRLPARSRNGDALSSSARARSDQSRSSARTPSRSASAVVIQTRIP